ncbi:Rho termination protein [Psychrobacillus antarcticus]|uniref:Rho termination protein n=1 Tax=Psychrobacillus antarcticus TaxID=2879115 RepID=UPI0024085D73|nr:Rho termination protein [Psychrobacillus antarcticus]
MGYKVKNKFKDKFDNNTLYNAGDDYPKGDYKPTEKRIDELSKEHSSYKRVFIEKVETDEEIAKREAEETAIAEQKAKEEAEAKAKAKADSKEIEEVNKPAAKKQVKDSNNKE